jgi:hypothetical protein
MAYSNPARRLYVLEVAGGVIKGGIARGTGAERVRQHRLALGGALLSEHVSECYVRGIEAERMLLTRLAAVGRLVRGREWFSGITFAQATQIVREVSEQFAHSDPDAQPSPFIRKQFSKLSFNDDEIALLDAYCARTGVSRAAACRDLVLGTAQRRAAAIPCEA